MEIPRETQNIEFQIMMSRIIFIIKQKIQIASQKAKKLKRKIIREKTMPKAFIQGKRMMC